MAENAHRRQNPGRTPAEQRPSRIISTRSLSSSSSLSADSSLTAHPITTRLSSRRPLAGHSSATAHIWRDTHPRLSPVVAPEQRPSPSFALRRFFSLPLQHRRSVDGSVSHLRVVYRNTIAGLRASVSALSLSPVPLLAPLAPATPAHYPPPARRPPTWVFPLCFAGSARSTPRSCPLC